MRSNKWIIAGVFAAIVGSVGSAPVTATEIDNYETCLSLGYAYPTPNPPCGTWQTYIDPITGLELGHCYPNNQVTLTSYYLGGSCQNVGGGDINCEPLTPAYQTLWTFGPNSCSAGFLNGIYTCIPPSPVQSQWNDGGQAPQASACHDSSGVYIGDQTAPRPPGW